MPRRLLAGIFVLFAASPLAAQAPTIEHQPVGCVVAKSFPRLVAQFAPPSAVATARVQLQTGNAREWYSVAMAPEGPSYSGILPRPKKSLKAFRYYIEMVDSGMGTRRTSEYVATVVGNAAECRGKMMASGLATATVLLQVPAGAAVVPLGFEAAGVAAAGSGAATSAGAAAASSGGGSGGLIAAGAGVLAAGAAAAVVVTRDGGQRYQGPVNGQVVFQRLYRPNLGAPELCSVTQTISGTLTITLEGSGTAGGSAGVTGTSRAGARAAGCESLGGDFGFNWGGEDNDELRLTGTPANLAFTGVRADPGGVTLTLSFAGSLSGDVITGALTFGQSGQINLPGSGTSTHSGSATFPVMLR
jgi:hypothetical protein